MTAELDYVRTSVQPEENVPSSDTYAKRPSRGAGFWSRADLGKLQFSFLFKDSLEETARKLGRSVQEIREKLQALGLLDPEPTASAVPAPLAPAHAAPVLDETAHRSPLPPPDSGEVPHPVPAQVSSPEAEQKPATKVVAINMASDEYLRASEADLRIQAARERIAAHVAGIGKPRFLRTKEEIETVQAFWRKESEEQIAVRLGCTAADVIECKRRHWTEEEDDTLKRLRDKGRYLADIARFLELPEKWVRERARDLGLPLVPTAKTPSPIPPPKRIIPAHVKNAAKAARASRKATQTARIVPEIASIAPPAPDASAARPGKVDAKVKVRVKTRGHATPQTPVKAPAQVPVQASIPFPAQIPISAAAASAVKASGKPAPAGPPVTQVVGPRTPVPATQKAAPAPAAQPQVAASSAARVAALPKKSVAAPATAVIPAPKPLQPAPERLAENWDVWDLKREMRLIDLYELGYSDSRMATELRTTAAEIRRMRKKLRL